MLLTRYSQSLCRHTSEGGQLDSTSERYDVFGFGFLVICDFGRGSIVQRWRAVSATQSVSVMMYLSLPVHLSLPLTLSLRSNFSEMEGSYSYTTSEGYDDFLKERGVPWIGRKLIIAAPIQLEVGLFSSLNTFLAFKVIFQISKENDLWTITYNSPARTTTFQFK